LQRNNAGVGGGAYNCRLYNCTVTDNSAVGNGGGAGYSTLYNCTVTGNSSGISGTAFNSIIYANTNGNYGADTILNYCLTSPLPTNGIGNIDADPRFLNPAAGDFRLRADSPCIDAGNNLSGLAIVPFPHYDEHGNWVVTMVPYAYDPTDILGNARGVDGNGDGKKGWDIGACEYGSFKPPRFAPQVQATPNGFQLSVSGEPNKPIQIERSSDLVNWTPWIVVSGSSNAVPYMDPQAGVQMFYRAVVE
jgi:hypothetical protein